MLYEHFIAVSMDLNRYYEKHAAKTSLCCRYKQMYEHWFDKTTVLSLEYLNAVTTPRSNSSEGWPHKTVDEIAEMCVDIMSISNYRFTWQIWVSRWRSCWFHSFVTRIAPFYKHLSPLTKQNCNIQLLTILTQDYSLIFSYYVLQVIKREHKWPKKFQIRT